VDTVEACTEHPERRPDPLSGRQPHARLDAPELCGESPLRLEACGRIGGALPLHVDDQVSRTIEMHVLREVRVILELPVTPPVLVAEVVGPLCGIGECIGWPVELFNPVLR